MFESAVRVGNGRRSVRGLVLLAALGTVVAGCATRRVVTHATLPPRLKAMGTQQRVRLIPFTGPRGEEATRRLRSAITRGGFHTLVDRDHEAQRAQELERALAAGQAAELASSAPEGATILISGQTHAGDYERDIEESSVRRCVRKNRKGKCTKMVDVPVYELSEVCRTTVRATIKSVEAGSVIFDQEFPGAEAVVRTEEGKKPAGVGAALCDAAFANAMEKLVHHVTPHQKQVSLDFRVISDPAGHTEKAMEAAKLSRLEQARTLLEKVVAEPTLSDEDRAWARYNLAVVLWALARFDECVRQTEMAQATLGADSDLVGLHHGCKEYLR